MAPADSNPEASSDHSLLVRWRRGQDDAFTELYLRYAERVRLLAESRSSKALAARVDPEDIVQSVFRTFFRKAATGHYDVPNGEELWSLLLVIALNKVRRAASHHKAAKRDVRRINADADPDIASSSRDNDQALTVLRLTIEEALADLPPLQREIIHLRTEGYEVAEIAAKVQRSKRTVERGLQQFRDRLNALSGDADDRDRETVNPFSRADAGEKP